MLWRLRQRFAAVDPGSCGGLKDFGLYYNHYSAIPPEPSRREAILHRSWIYRRTRSATSRHISLRSCIPAFSLELLAGCDGSEGSDFRTFGCRPLSGFISASCTASRGLRCSFGGNRGSAGRLVSLRGSSSSSFFFLRPACRSRELALARAPFLTGPIDHRPALWLGPSQACVWSASAACRPSGC